MVARPMTRFLSLIVPFVLAVGAYGSPLLPDDLATQLARLAGPDGLERARAERWLGRNLETRDFDELVAGLTRGAAGTETRLRLARAIGSDPGHLGLAVAFLAESDAELSTVGRLAVERLSHRWNDALEREVVGSELREFLRGLGEKRDVTLVFADPTLPLEANLAALGRLGHLAIGWALADEEARAPQPSGDVGPVSNAWSELLFELAARRELSVRGFGMKTDQGELRRATGFLVFEPRRAVHGSGIEWIVDWCLAFVNGGSLAVRTRAAKNLARIRWPAALAWLEEAWRENGDTAALEGLLCAAGEGRVASVLLHGSTVTEWLRRAEVAQQAGDGELAHRLVAGVSALGALGPGGEELTPAVLEGFAASSLVGRWQRLVVLTAWGVWRPEIEEVVVSALTADTPPALALQALRTRAGLLPLLPIGHAPLAPESIAVEAWWRGLADADEAREWTRLLVRNGFAPDPAWSDPGRAPLGNELARGALFGWLLGRGEVEAASAWLVALLAGGRDSTALAFAVDELRARHERDERQLVLAVYQGALARVQDDRAATHAVERAGALVGCLPALRLPRFVDDAKSRGNLASDDALLAALGRVDDVLGRDARATLLARSGSGEVDGDPPAIWLEACEDVLAGLFGAGSDEAAYGFLGDLTRLARGGRSSWARALQLGRWPHPPRVDARLLQDRERRLDPEAF